MFLFPLITTFAYGPFFNKRFHQRWPRCDGVRWKTMCAPFPLIVMMSKRESPKSIANAYSLLYIYPSSGVITQYIDTLTPSTHAWTPIDMTPYYSSPYVLADYWLYVAHTVLAGFISVVIAGRNITATFHRRSLYGPVSQLWNFNSRHR